MGSSQSQETVSEGHEVYSPIPPPRISEGAASQAGYIVIQAPPARIIPERPKNVALSRMTLPIMIDKNTVTVLRPGDSDFIVKAFILTKSNAGILVKVSKEDGTVIASEEIHGIPTSRDHREELSCTLKSSTVIGNHEKVHVDIIVSQGDSQVRCTVVLHDTTQKIEGLSYTDESYPSGLDLLPLYVSQPQDHRLDELSGSQPNGNVETICSICLMKKADIGFLPCRHVCVCSDCSAITLSSSYNHCPMCRQLVTGRISLQ